MEESITPLKALFEETKQYAITSAELYKLKAVDKSADVISAFTAYSAVVLFIALFFLVLSVGVALLVGEKLGGAYYGFFVVAGFYGLIGIVLFVFRTKLIKRPIRNSIITQILKPGRNEKN